MTVILFTCLVLSSKGDTSKGTCNKEHKDGDQLVTTVVPQTSQPIKTAQADESGIVLTLLQ